MNQEMNQISSDFTKGAEVRNLAKINIASC